MAKLITCKGCGKPVYTSWEKCQHCGLPTEESKEPAARPVGLFSWISAAFAVVLVLIFVGSILIGFAKSVGTKAVAVVQDLPKVVQQPQSVTVTLSPIEQLERMTPAAISPGGDLAEMFSYGNDFTDLQRQLKFAEIKGKVVRWTLPVYEVSQAGDGYRIQTTSRFRGAPSNEQFVGTFLLITPRSEEDRRFVERIKTGDAVTFKGVINDVTLRSLDIRPAFLVKEAAVAPAVAVRIETPSTGASASVRLARTASWKSAKEIPPFLKGDHQAELGIVKKVFSEDLARAKADDPRSEVRIDIATIDLNEDGIDELIVEFTGSGFCGAGSCQMSILSRRPDGTWAAIADLLGAKSDLRVSSIKMNGYKVVLFGESSELRYENGKYVPYLVSDTSGPIGQK
jgi:hypothetical protein